MRPWIALGLACFTFGLLAMMAARPLLAEHDYPIPKQHTWRPGGALSGGDYLDCPMCDIVGPRNLQGGKHTGRPIDLNLDIGAGSTENPGDVVLNYDVGRRVLIYDGRRRKLAAFSRRGIVFYKRPVVRR